ncbi:MULTISPECIES: hypothetical protein [unclassified Nocardioides]|uniref:hypothetical protein n=1 Tax=unclassified Nocardioides TaxID=2615069 RepID=UPI0012E332C3|nr:MULTISPECIES: hypothetical protein [unclassified Nocardioides]
MPDQSRRSGAGTLWLGAHTRSEHQLSLQFGLDDLRFTASYWYEDVDLVDLERRYGTDVLDRVYFHLAAFTANTLVSLQPATFDPGPYQRHCTPEFWALWRGVVHGVWAQWRFEHDLPDYEGPDLLRSPAEAVPSPVSTTAHGDPDLPKVLAFFGGGKDSVVSLRLLQRSGIPCDTLVYSSSTYGCAEKQHALCSTLLDALAMPAGGRRRIWSYDDLVDSPVARLMPHHDLLPLTAAETPASVFAAVPLVLAHGYRGLCLGHERSADSGNTVRSPAGDEVNHQWGKSAECEEVLAGYLRTHLVADCHYFSPLKAVHDPLIFTMLAAEPGAIAFTHSCNVDKPWCGRCAKCAYVWLGYSAYLDPDIVQRTFRGHGNLLDHPDNQVWFRQLLGLADHTPFECVGGIDETRLAFELCRRRGLRGTAMEMFEREVAPVDVDGLLTRYLGVGSLGAWCPPALRAPIEAELHRAAARAFPLLATS